MNEQTIKLVNDLAAKLGTTAEHLWAVLVKQAPITSGIELLGIVLYFAVLFWCVKRLAKYCKANPDECCEPPAVFGWAGIGIFAVVLLMIFSSQMPLIFAGFFNPEYWALKQLIH